MHLLVPCAYHRHRSPYPAPLQGNGTSVLIFAGIASSLPASVGALLAANASDDPGNVAVYAIAFFLTTLGIIYVQVRTRGRQGLGAGCLVLVPCPVAHCPLMRPTPRRRPSAASR